ncbi:hypothetical protein ACM66B_006841 [Microbotryomycetes sp. NB124-2]
MSTDSPNPLSSHLARMSLSHGALQDEDLTLTLPDDDDTINHDADGGGGGREQQVGRNEVAFGGSMGVVPTSQRYDQLGSAEATTPRATKGTAATAGARADATTPINSGAAARYDDDDELQQDYEDDDIDVEGADVTEDEKKRIAELRDERDGLRVMNKTLKGLLSGLQGVDAKLQVLGENIETAHGLLDLYSRIAAQAEHTQALLLDTQWQGVTHDAQMLIEREAEAARLAQEEADRLERERIEAEEAAAAAAEAAELAAQRKAAGGDLKRGARGRGRGVPSLRGTTSSGPSTASRIGTTGAGRGASPATTTSTRGSGSVTGVRGVRGLRSRVMTRGAASTRGRGTE